MKELWIYVQMAFTAIGGWLGWFLGGVDGFLYALIAFVVIDYVTGFMCAILEKKLSSEVGARGIFKKVIIFTLVGVAHIIDTRIIGEGGAIRTAVIFFYLSNAQVVTCGSGSGSNACGASGYTYGTIRGSYDITTTSTYAFNQTFIIVAN